MTDLHHLTIAEAGRMFRTSELSPVELTTAYLDRIDRLDDQLHTYLTVTGDRALAEAAVATRELADGVDRGPMHGIPYGLKDAYETAAVRTTGHSKVLEHHVPAADAEAQRRLRAGGGVLLGKHALWEFTFGGPSYDQPWPPALNPWDSSKALMGSSTGSGAAIAAGLCAGAMGSDTGGSIRSPAALCGIAGVKPTYGRVSRAGILPNTFSFDHAGPMAWTVEDCALMLQVVAGHDPADPASIDEPVDDYVAGLRRPLAGVRMGVIRDWYTEEGSVTVEVADAVDAAAAVFEDLGCEVVELRSGSPGAAVPTMREFLDCKIPITLSEIWAAFEPHLRARPEDFGRQFRYRIISGFLVSGPDYVQALRWRTDLARRMLANFGPDGSGTSAGVDLMLTAGHLGSPPPVDPDAPPSVLKRHDTVDHHTVQPDRSTRPGRVLRLRVRRVSHRHAARRPSVR